MPASPDGSTLVAARKNSSLRARVRRLLVVAGIAVFSLVSAGADEMEIDIPYTKYVLDNGLTLIVHEDHKAPIVAVNVWYHVGSKNEKLRKTGFAHLFEHLMFNGSENYNDDYFRPLEKVGVTDINGTTNEDRTNYFQNVPTPALDLALWMESDRMGHLLGAIDQAKLDEQRGVVQNEKRQGENQPYGVAYELITKNTFPAGHPYSWTVIGEMEDLDAASLEDVKDWFQKYYGAANAVIAVAGDIDPETAKKKVEHFFGDIPSGPPVPRQSVWVAKRTGEHRQLAEDRVPQARIYKIWNIPQGDALETTRLRLAAALLGDGKNSRLYRRLVYKDQIATDVAVVIDSREIASLFWVQATAQPGGDLRKVEQAIDEELAKFLKEGPSKEELERVQTQYRAGFIRRIERIGGFGGKSDVLAMNEVFTGRPDFYKVTLQRIAGATPGEVRKTAEEWLSDGVYVLEIHPFPKYQNQEKGAERSKLPEVSGFPKLDLPELQKATLSNGLKVILAERHEIPVINFSLLVDAGYAADKHAAPGVASMTLDMVDEGTKTRSSFEISETLDRLGADLGTGSTLDRSSVTLSALRENLDPSLEIYADIILNPSFPQEDFDRLKKQRLARIQQEKSSPFATALRLLPALIYGHDHPYGTPFTGSGTEASVQAMTREDLRRFHGSWLQPSNATLIVVGDTTLATVIPKLEKVLGGWKDTVKAPGKTIAKVPLPAKRTVYLVDKPDAQQSLIIAGVPAPATNNPREIAIETMNNILGGSFTSRINMNLREDKHWSYGARTYMVDARGQRMFFAYASVQTDKTRESMQEINKEFRQILNEKPASAEELDKAIKNQTLQLPGRFETKQALQGAIGEILTFGLPEDYYETYVDKVNALKLEEITAAAKEVVHPDHLVWVVVGDRSKIEPGLKELGLGDVKHMSPDGDVLD